MSLTRLSVVDKLVLAAFGLENSGRVPFTAEDLVVSAWKAFPDTFGLPGYADSRGVNQYPDSNRVFAEIMGSKPIRQKGWLAKDGNKLYRLTEAGRQHGSILSRSKSDGTEKISLERPQREEIERLLKSKATEKFRSGLTDEIIFPDACAFWRISARSAAIEFTGRYNNADQLLEAAKNAALGKDFTFRHGGAPISLSDLSVLEEVHKFMRERFQDEIGVILQRTYQRV
ncbi:MAG: hypothetical protein A3H28_06985 [Acidobacteria bacterium RIFCSPLOWO2_02_FULL_61_28]|nr:MAG: hypothetical protein A3H28_06985 [Acidobacteria bacterium RIFCSPLOWO2_02_FULL_61_28]